MPEADHKTMIENKICLLTSTVNVQLQEPNTLIGVWMGLCKPPNEVVPQIESDL